MNGLETAANVAQAVGLDFGRLISMIGQAARTAQQNTRDCQHLARRVALLAELVPRLQVDPEARRAVAGLDATLLEAHSLVLSCQGRGFVSQLFSASTLSGRFRDVDRKLDTYLSVIPLISYIGVARRLDANPPSSVVVRSQSQEETGAAGDCWEFTLAEIVVATSNFAVVLSDDGDTGTKVYRGRLHGGAEVAVKRLNLTRRGGAEDAFFKEQQILAPLRHAHIVRLLGTCADDGERMLVTEYMPNGSLADHLHGRRSGHHLPSSSPPSPVAASWKARVRALLGAARGVEHLHRHAVPLVIHGNVASSSVLLDAAWAPRLSGFGKSVWRAAGVDSQPVDDGGVSGAGGGYADPEYYRTGRIRPATDVYGLGVVMLEALTGKPPVVSAWDEAKQVVVPMTLPSFVVPAVRAGRLGEELDRRPAPWPATRQQLQPLQLVADLAVRCLSGNGDQRPAISDVVATLEQALRLM